jgi:hypothetical protein
VYDVSSLIPNEQSQNHQAPDQDQWSNPSHRNDTSSS